MKRVRILSVWWAATAIATAALVPPRGLGAQGTAQGIKVHGHWSIEVRNADGTLRLRRDFENSLLDGGRTVISQLLSGGGTVDYWVVYLFTLGGGGPCSGGTCNITEPSGPSTTDSRNLTKTVTPGSQLVLHGSFVATTDAAINVVGTNVVTTQTGTSLPIPYPFTSATLASAISVQATQTVSVTVTFTFS